VVLRATRWLARPALLRALWRDVRLGARLLRERRVPWWAKLTLPIAVLYLASPFDVLPDFIIGIGELDDLLVLYGSLKVFLYLCPREAVAFHGRALKERQPFRPMPADEVVIDAEYRRG
jgi:uncharacterized membrane protein YkvA (DUF1232 family)